MLTTEELPNGWKQVLAPAYFVSTIAATKK